MSLMRGDGKLVLISFTMSASCQTLSKALEMSRKMAAAFFF